MVNNYTWIYILFLCLLGLSTLLDFSIFKYKSKNSWRLYFWQMLFWVLLALGFAYGLGMYLGTDIGVKFLSAYFLEFSLSMDNVFVFILIFSTWGLPVKIEHKALFLGIIIAIVLRIIFIFIGIKTVQSFSWILYIFGIFLLYTGTKLLLKNKNSSHKHQPSLIEKLMIRYLPINSNPIYMHKFLFRIDGRLVLSATGMVIILMAITDLIFALDSIPSVIGLLKRKNSELFTEQEILIMYSSNIFAVIGLRPLYLLLKSASQNFHLLSYAIAVILIYVGIDLLIGLFKLHLPYQIFPIFLLLSIGSSIVLSYLIPPSNK